MVKFWHSLAWKIAIANILLAIFAVVASMAVRYHAERRLIETDARRELAQSVATGSLLLGGDQIEALVDRPSPSTEKNLDAILRSLAGGTPGLDHLYVLARVSGKVPRLLGGLGLAPGAEFPPVVRTALDTCLDRGEPVTTELYGDARGQWISVLYPLRDSRGRVAAALGADWVASDLKLETQGRLRTILLSGFAAALVATLLSFFLARGVTRPLKLVAESTSQIASGNLNVSLSLKSRDEIGDLANSFNQMAQRLSAAAEERERLQKELLEKQRFEQELSLAAVIQQSFLPLQFPRSPRYRVEARTLPAKVVGGDFYDFVQLSPDRIGLVIGDVAGRGIAAALYLARLISDFRTEALRASGPREALERLNDCLLARSTRGMFVTMTYLVLDAAFGEVAYSSAGHLPSLCLHGATHEAEPLDGGMGLPLGMVKHPGLNEQRLVFEAGDALVLVTDGVIEAMNGKYSASSLAPLLGVFRRPGFAADHVVDAVFEEVCRRAPVAFQEDDMTVLSLSWTASRSEVAGS